MIVFDSGASLLTIIYDVVEYFITYIERILHGVTKICLLFSSGENNILRTSAAGE